MFKQTKSRSYKVKPAGPKTQQKAGKQTENQAFGPWVKTGSRNSGYDSSGNIKGPYAALGPGATRTQSSGNKYSHLKGVRSGQPAVYDAPKAGSGPTYNTPFGKQPVEYAEPGNFPRGGYAQATSNFGPSSGKHVRVSNQPNQPNPYNYENPPLIASKVGKVSSKATITGRLNNKTRSQYKEHLNSIGKADYNTKKSRLSNTLLGRAKLYHKLFLTNTYQNYLTKKNNALRNTFNSVRSRMKNIAYNKQIVSREKKNTVFVFADPHSLVRIPP